MDLRQCRVFVEIAREKNFTKAAKRLNIAQSAVSITLRKLEEDLGLLLINRQVKRICLTAEGETFLRHAQQILDKVKTTQAEMDELRGLQRGEVRIGIPPMMSAYYFPQVIREFSRRYPQLQLSVYGDGAAKIQQMIAHGEIDLGVIATGVIPEGMEGQCFLREEIVAVVSENNQLAQQESITISEFLRQPLISFKAGYYMREFINELAKTARVKPQIVFESNLFSLVRSLIGEDGGVSTLLKMAVINEPGVKAISFDPPQYLDLMLAWKTDGYLSHANRAFADFLLKQVAKNNSTGITQ
jgi:DNA-binding transcriptional LysR family regulator